jgi:hypothetical protein
MTTTLPLLSELLVQLDTEEHRIIESVSRRIVLARPLHAAVLSYRARWRLLRYVRRATRHSEPATRARLFAAARQYIRTRIGATRRVAEYQAYVRLFSWWHVMHLPLFLLLLIAGIAHVIAVHVY